MRAHKKHYCIWHFLFTRTNFKMISADVAVVVVVHFYIFLPNPNR